MSTKLKSLCVKCKEVKEMVDVSEVTLRNNQKAKKGKCISCGTGMYKIN